MDDGEAPADDTLAKLGIHKNAKVQGMHEFAAAVVSRMLRTGEKRDRDLAEGLYRQQFSISDALPPLASYGLVVEIDAVREIIVRELGGVEVG